MRRTALGLAAFTLALTVGEVRAAAVPPELGAAVRQIDGLLEAWRFRDAATALAAL